VRNSRLPSHDGIQSAVGGLVRRCLPADSVRCHLDGGRAKRIIDTSGRSLDRPPARKSQGIGTSLQLGFCLLYSHRCLDMSTSDMRPHFSPRNPPLPDDFDDDEAHDVSSPGSIIEADVGFCDTGCATRICPRLSSANPTFNSSQSHRMVRKAVARSYPLSPTISYACSLSSRSTKSLNQSIFNFVRENGRTYHRYQAGCKISSSSLSS
jgi:hypothetical protein